MTTPNSRSLDPLSILREYRQLAPWSLRDMATLAGAILESSGVRPLNAVASPHPTERTIRFYVARGLVTPPHGRGTAATYTYRHLLQVLHIKLRQMEGSTLAAITQELTDMTGDVLERRVASALGAALPSPNRLPLTSRDRLAWGRAGRALHAWTSDIAPEESSEGGTQAGATTWRRLPVSRGMELHMHDSHPLARLENRDAEIADAIRLAVTRILGQARSRSTSTDHSPESESPDSRS